MLYVALGDSITYGYSCTSENFHFTNIIYETLRKSNRFLHHFILAKPGWRIAQLNKAVERVPECLWDETKYLTLLIGGNDLLRAFPMLLHNENRITDYAQTFQKELDKLLLKIKRPRMTICLGTIYNPFPKSILAEKCVQAFNEVIQRIGKRHRVLVVDLFQSFLMNEKQLIDGFGSGDLKDFRIVRANPIHPTNKGHAKIAHVFLAKFAAANKRKNQRSMSVKKRVPRNNKKFLK